MPWICLQPQIKFILVAFVAKIVSQAFGQGAWVAQKQTNRKCAAQNKTLGFRECIYWADNKGPKNKGPLQLWCLHVKLQHVRDKQGSKANPTLTAARSIKWAMSVMRFYSVNTKTWEICVSVIKFNPPWQCRFPGWFLSNIQGEKKRKEKFILDGLYLLSVTAVLVLLSIRFKKKVGERQDFCFVLFVFARCWTLVL